MDLTEAEDIKKRWQEYTELYKKDLHNSDNHDGVITHLEPDSWKAIKWVLGSITTNNISGGDRIPAELFQILKDDAVKVLHSIWQQICKTQQWPQDWKRSVFVPVQRKAMPKNAQTTTQLHSSHMLATEKAMVTHSSVLAWRIPGTGEPVGLPSMGSHRVGHD